MAIKLWPHMLRTAAPLTDPPVPIEGMGWLAGEWILERRDRSEWNPPAAALMGASASDGERAEAQWPDTQPWCHD
jgi:hypothetical protein